MDDAAIAVEHELADFVAREARLLDARRYDEWLALFAENGRYWVPLRGAAQAEGEAYNALADEDRLLLALRIERLRHPRAHSQRPPSRGQHVLQRSTVVEADPAAGRYELHTPFLYVESRGERQLTLAGNARHRLVRRGALWLIELKRIDLLNADSPLPAIELFP
jgi:3-phenylpropionate/cinnamic acid dioxygenase small subunit